MLFIASSVCLHSQLYSVTQNSFETQSRLFSLFFVDFFLYRYLFRPASPPKKSSEGNRVGLRPGGSSCRNARR